MYTIQLIYTNGKSMVVTVGSLVQLWSMVESARENSNVKAMWSWLTKTPTNPRCDFSR